MKKFAKILMTVLLSAVCAFSFAACFDLEGGGGTEGGGNGGGGNGGGGELTGTVYKYDGTYEVGSDIEAGEYLLIKSGLIGYYEVATEKNPSLDKILYNGSYIRQYVKVNDGEFLKFSGGKLFKLDSAPKLIKESDNGYKAGQYKVGRDIEAGEYVVTESSKTTNVYLELTAIPNAQIGSEQFLFNENFHNRHYVKAEDGQYLNFNAGKLYSLEEAPAVQKESDNGFAAGQYKVGRDIEAGEYIIVDKTDGGLILLEQTTQPFAKVSSPDRLFIENFVYRHYVKLEEGQYISFKGGKLYALEQAPEVKTDNAKYYAGQYKVGADIPAGTYTVEVPEGKSVYYLITTLPLCDITSAYFVKNGNFYKSDNITLSEGQYVTISRGRLTAA